MKWSDALAAVAGLHDGDCEGRLDDGSAPGDWRLPNIKELETLVDFDPSPTLPAALPAGHLFLPQDFFTLPWSSTTVAEFPDCAWSLHFTSGIMHFYTGGDAPPGTCSGDNKKDGVERGVWPVKGPVREL
jgi:hypothetical protein